MKSVGRLKELEERIRSWDGGGFTTREICDYVKNYKGTPLWIRYAGAHRIASYLAMLKRMNVLSFDGQRWHLTSE